MNNVVDESRRRLLKNGTLGMVLIPIAGRLTAARAADAPGGRVRAANRDCHYADP